jgi:hypothetical protein
VKHAARSSARRQPAAAEAGLQVSTGQEPGAGQRAVGRSRADRRLSQLAYLALLAGVGFGVLYIQTGHAVQSGTLVLAGVLLLAALARLTLPEQLIGMLGTRQRLTDVAVLATFGFGLLATGLVIPA